MANVGKTTSACGTDPATQLGLFIGPYPVFGFPGGSDGKASAYKAGDPGSIPGSGGSPGGGNRNPLWYSSLGNLMDEEPGGLQSMGSQELDRTEPLHYLIFLLSAGPL